MSASPSAVETAQKAAADHMYDSLYDRCSCGWFPEYWDEAADIRFADHFGRIVADALHPVMAAEALRDAAFEFNALVDATYARADQIEAKP